MKGANPSLDTVPELGRVWVVRVPVPVPVNDLGVFAVSVLSAKLRTELPQFAYGHGHGHA